MSRWCITCHVGASGTEEEVSGFVCLASLLEIIDAVSPFDEPMPASCFSWRFILRRVIIQFDVCVCVILIKVSDFHLAAWLEVQLDHFWVVYDMPFFKSLLSASMYN